MFLSPERASELGKRGALSLHARHDVAAFLVKARAAFNEQFVREVDPDSTLDPAERARQADLARRAYYLRLAAKSAAARRQRQGGAA